MNNFTRFIACAFACVFMAGSLSAQSFHFTSDTVKRVVSGFETIHNDIQNTSSNPIQVTWQVIYHDLPTDWQPAIGICDNKNCYQSILGFPGPSKTSADIAASGSGLFDAQLDASTLSPGGPFYVTVEMKEGTTTQHGTFQFNKWPTGVATVAKVDDAVVLYPNPAANELYVSLRNADLGVKTIILANPVGQVVSVYPVTGLDTKLSLKDLPSGTYFVKLLDGQNNTAAVRRVAH